MTITLTNNQARDLLNAHNQLDGYQDVIEKNGQKIAVPKSFIFPVSTKVDITKNIKNLREHVVRANELRDDLLKRISGGENEIDGEKEPEKLKEFSKGAGQIEDDKIEIKGLVILKMENLMGCPLEETEGDSKKDKDKDKKPNPIPQTALASLAPVLDIFQPEEKSE